jgi:bacillithiol system protein YtxJ
MIAAFGAILTPEDAAAAFDASHHDHAVLIYKHSPICDLSEGALEEMRAFLAGAPAGLDARIVDVLSARPASQWIEARAEVRHESPQALVIRNGVVTWHASHRRVTATAVAGAMM